MKLLYLLLALIIFSPPSYSQQGNFVKISTDTYEVIYPTNFWLKNRTNIWVEIEGFLNGLTNGASGSNSFGVNGVFYTPWNYTNSAEIAHIVSGTTNFSSSIVANSISTNKIDSTFRSWVTSMGSSGSGVTVNSLPATNFWDNGYITFLDAGGGDWSLNIGNDTISTNKINSTFYNWVLSLAGAGGGTTNGLGVNGTFRTDWNAITSAEIAYTVSAGTNWYGSLIAGSVGANKLATTGTGTSTNFLAGDYSYKQVTTNMIPGLNAILATIGSGSGTNYTQFWYDLTNSVVSSNNISLAYDNTNKKLLISASTGGTNSGTVVTVDGGADNVRVNLADTARIGVSLSGTNASFDIVSASITSNYLAAANVTQDKLSATGTATSTNFLAGDYTYKQVTTNMIPGLVAALASLQSSLTFTNGVTNSANVVSANLAAGSNITFATNNGLITIASTASGSGTGTVVTANGGSDMSRANITTNGFGLLVTQSSINILLSITNNYPSDYFAGGFLPLYAGISNSITGNLHYKKSSDIRSPMWESGTEWNAMGMRASGGVWSVVEYNTNDFTVLESFITVNPTDTTGPTDIITFPNSGFNNKVVFEADVELNGNVVAATQTLGTSNTTVATTAFVIQNAGGGSGSDTNWNGNPIASGTITNLTTSSINGVEFYNDARGDVWSDGHTTINSLVTFFPYGYGAALASGTSVSGTGTTNRPSIQRLRSSASANSGYSYYGSGEGIILGGSEFTELLVTLCATNGTVMRFGFLDSVTTTEPTDGAYFELANGWLYGMTASNSTRTVSASSNLVAISSTSPDRLRIRVNSTASSVNFQWVTATAPGVFTTNLNTDISATITTTRATSHGFVVYNVPGGASDQLYVDAVGLKFNRAQTR
jgi:hypothetical protein